MEEIFLKDTYYKIRFDILTDLYGKYRKVYTGILRWFSGLHNLLDRFDGIIPVGKMVSNGSYNLSE